MTEVIMEGRFKGYTREEYEAMRKLDCEIAETMGWAPLDHHRVLWVNPCSPDSRALRDEDGGIPFFLADANGIMDVLLHVVRRWRYSARNVFYAKLQYRASFDSQGVVAYPDCLTSLISSGLPEHIAHAYLETVSWARSIDFNLYDKPTPEGVKIALQESIDAVTGEIVHKAKITALPGKPPWVHQ